jgi:GTP-binding protein
MIKGYLKKREQLQYVMQLVDSRIPPQKIDLEFAAWLGAAHIPFVIIFTKADKPGSRETATNVQLYKNEMLKEWAELPPCFVTSAERKSGADEVWSFVSDAVDLYFRTTPLANVSKG